jgi:cobalt/nickel transport system permease protein
MMHISEGVLSSPVIIGGYVVSAGLTALSLKQLQRRQIPKIAVMGAAFFVSSLLHFKVGITSVHLTLAGLVGIVLGFPAVLALLAGLFFQAVMFQHGGLSTLGVNTVIFALPALLAYLAYSGFGPLAGKRLALRALIAAGASALAVMVGAVLVLLVLRLSGEELTGIGFLFSAGHGLLALLEGVITFIVVSQILRVKPEMIAIGITSGRKNRIQE